MNIFDRIYFILAGNEDINTFRITLKFVQIRPGNERQEKSPRTYNVKNIVTTLAPSFFDSIIFVLAGNEDIHKSFDEYEIQQDKTTNSRVSCPCTSEKLLYNVVNTLASDLLHICR